MPTHTPGAAARQQDARWRFGLFAALLAVALLLHQVWWDGFEVASLHGVVVLAALAVLARPTSVARLLVLLAVEVVAVAADMPGAGSHTLLAAVCAATVLVDVAWTARSTRRLPDAGALFERIAPFLRLSVIVLYVAAALAKMNRGFFDAAQSCAAAMTGSIAWFDPTLLDGAWLAAPAIYGTVLVEAALPVLLAWRRTRIAGLALGVGFHLVLAFAGNVPFSSLMLALYVAFLPAGAVRRVGARVPVWRAPSWAPTAVLAALVGAWLLAGLAADAEPEAARTAIAYATRLVVLALVAGIAAAAVVARRWRTGPVPVRDTGLRLGHPVLAAGIAVLVANALTPYLGLKTESSFAMFSNLQTEAGAWNHAFVPEAVRVFPHQDRLVTVTASDDPLLLRRTTAGTRMMRFELERYLRLHPGTRATYTEPGAGAPRTVVFADAPALSVTALVDRVAKFRDVRAAGRRGC